MREIDAIIMHIISLSWERVCIHQEKEQVISEA